MRVATYACRRPPKPGRPSKRHGRSRGSSARIALLLVISPYAKRNSVDHTLTTQVSISRVMEDNWLQGPRLGNGSFEANPGTMSGRFDVAHPDEQAVVLAP
jgi:phospholipase C